VLHCCYGIRYRLCACTTIFTVHVFPCSAICFFASPRAYAQRGWLCLLLPRCLYRCLLLDLPLTCGWRGFGWRSDADPLPAAGYPPYYPAAYPSVRRHVRRTPSAGVDGLFWTTSLPPLFGVLLLAGAKDDLFRRYGGRKSGRCQFGIVRVTRGSCLLFFCGLRLMRLPAVSAAWRRPARFLTTYMAAAAVLSPALTQRAHLPL